MLIQDLTPAPLLTTPNNLKNANGLSQHLTGNAFDVQPVGGEEGKRQIAVLKSFGGKVLDREAGIEKRHYASPQQNEQTQKSPRK